MAKQEIKGTKKIVSLRGLKHLAGLLLSLVSSPNGTKVQLCTNFVNERRQNNRSFSYGLNEKACGQTTIYRK